MVIQLDDAKIKVKLDIVKLETDLDKADSERDKRKERREGRKKTKKTNVIAVPGIGKVAMKAAGAVMMIELVERYLLPAVMEALKQSGWSWVADLTEKGLDGVNSVLDKAIEGWGMLAKEMGLSKKFVSDANEVIDQMRDAGFIGTAKTMMGVMADMKKYIDHAALLGQLPGTERLAEIGVGTARIRLAEEEMAKAMQQREVRILTDQLMKRIGIR